MQAFEGSEPESESKQDSNPSVPRGYRKGKSRSGTHCQMQAFEGSELVCRAPKRGYPKWDTLFLELEMGLEPTTC